jgi:hypothetical protein
MEVAVSRSSRRLIVATLTALSTGACVTPTVMVTGTTPSKQMLTTSSRLVTTGDLERFADLPLDMALMRLRPELLRFRGTTPLVYINGRPALEGELHSLSAGVVGSVQLLSPGEATFEYGSLYGTGAILDVKLRRLR